MEGHGNDPDAHSLLPLGQFGSERREERERKEVREEGRREEEKRS